MDWIHFTERRRCIGVPSSCGLDETAAGEWGYANTKPSPGLCGHVAVGQRCRRKPEMSESWRGKKNSGKLSEAQCGRA